jgi:3-isopropylmalate dehydrogenase
MIGQKKLIVLLPGDGIGPENVRVAGRVLNDCAAESGHHFELAEIPFGGCAIDSAGMPLPAETLAACRAADAILLGAVGGAKWDELPIGKRPESGLLALRKELGLYINLRPIDLRPALLATSEVERVANYAFARAEARTGRLASIDKANVLSTSQLWRRTVTRLAADHPGVKLEHLYVDNAAMQLVLAPAQFDVILTSNMFGDILSDLGAALVGSIGLIPSMSCGPGPSLYEPIHGSAPSLAGKDIASPVGTILSASMMLRESFGLRQEAEWIESAVDRLFAQGIRTADIAEPGATTLRCSEFGERLHAEMLDTVERHAQDA